MRKYFLIPVFFFCFYQFAFPQGEGEAVCPNVSIDGPSAEWTKPGDSIIFTANVRMNKHDGLKYHWIASEGTIVSRLGTASIEVQTESTSAGKLLVTVQIDGLPDGCSKTAFREQFIEDRIGDPAPVDQYGKSSFVQEMHHLKTLIQRLRSDPSVSAFIVKRYKYGTSPALITGRSHLIRQYLQRNGISKDRFMLVSGRFEKDSTSYYLILRSGTQNNSPIQLPKKT